MNTVNKVKPILVDSLFKLLRSKSINEISIIELIKNSGVSRASFYRNFNTIDEVFAYFFENEILKEIEFDFSNKLALETSLLKLLNNINKKDENFDLIVKNNLTNILGNLLKQKFAPYLSEINSLLASNILVSLLTYWSTHQYIETPFEIVFLFFIQTKNIETKCPELNKESKVVISVDNMRKSDAYTIANITSSKELMYRAGLEVYKNVHWKGKIGIVCGKGNNAGDGYVLASLLKENNYDVELLLIEEKFSEDGLYYFNKAKENKVAHKVIEPAINFNKYDILVDCIFGTGFKGDVKEPIKSIINKINESKSYVVSVDINSGLNGDTGTASTCVISDLTISIGNYKSGHFLNKAKDVIKSKINVDIGIKALKEEYTLLGANDAKNCLKDRPNNSNKGTFGYIGLIGGSKLYGGAIRLANFANTTMTSGSGVTLLAVPSSLADSITPQILESTIYPLSENNGEIKFVEKEINSLMKRCRCIAVGMGLGNTQETVKLVKYLLNNYDGILIIDADGLNALSTIDLDILKTTKSKVVLTPHIKEFSRLIKVDSITDILNDEINLLINFNKEYKTITLLKGPTTIVNDGIKTYLIDRGCSGMATAGSGDVLSGILSAICSYNQDNLLLAVATGAYINGLAGEIAELNNGQISMIASETAENVKHSINLIKTAQ